MSEKHIGKVIQVIGPVLDIHVRKMTSMPELLNAIVIDRSSARCWTSSSRMAELAGDNVACCNAMSSIEV